MTVTANDVVKIIQAAKTSKVSKITLDGILTIEFDTNPHPYKTKNNANHMEVASTVDSRGQLPGSLLSTYSESDDKVSDNEMMLEELADQMAIEDPAQFEELQLKLMHRTGSTN